MRHARHISDIQALSGNCENMMHRFLLGSAAGLWIGLFAVTFAAEPTTDDPTTVARKEFDRQVTELRQKYQQDVAAATTSYVAKLDEQLKTETAKGDLDKVVALKAERDRVEKDPPTERAKVGPSIQSLRNAYELKIRAARISYEKAAKQAVRDQLATLDQLIKEKTKAGEIEAALAIRNSRKEFEKSAIPGPVAQPEPSPSDEKEKTEPATAPDEKPTEKPANPPAGALKINAKQKKSAGSVEWKDVIGSPAKVQVAAVDSVIFDPQEVTPPFSRVPEMFKRYKTRIFAQPMQDGVGIVDITVTDPGYLLVACNYSYQGNSSGGWMETRWTAEQFVANGWNPITPDEVGGLLVKGTDREQTLFLKQVKKGETLRLRCNKYDPPYPILFEPGQVAQTPVIPAPTKLAKVPAKQAAPYSGRRIDWKQIASAPAQVTVMGLEPVALIPDDDSHKFQQIPELLKKQGAVIFSKPVKEAGAVAEITVVNDGYALVACDYGYQGNKSGDWLEKRWTPEQFVEHGWRRVTIQEVGGPLATEPDRNYELFVKYLQKGEDLRLRCNKHVPPFVILLGASVPK